MQCLICSIIFYFTTFLFSFFYHSSCPPRPAVWKPLFYVSSSQITKSFGKDYGFSIVLLLQKLRILPSRHLIDTEGDLESSAAHLDPHSSCAPGLKSRPFYTRPTQQSNHVVSVHDPSCLESQDIRGQLLTDPLMTNDFCKALPLSFSLQREPLQVCTCQIHLHRSLFKCKVFTIIWSWTLLSFCTRTERDNQRTTAKKEKNSSSENSGTLPIFILLSFPLSIFGGAL